jgi:hypothetical protein
MTLGFLFSTFCGCKGRENGWDKVISAPAVLNFRAYFQILAAFSGHFAEARFYSVRPYASRHRGINGVHASFY